MDWVLVIALYWYSPAVTHIPGFKTETDCIKAGEKAALELKYKNEGRRGTVAYSCLIREVIE